MEGLGGVVLMLGKFGSEVDDGAEGDLGGAEAGLRVGVVEKIVEGFGGLGGGGLELIDEGIVNGGATLGEGAAVVLVEGFPAPEGSAADVEDFGNA
jgi:hypothetical protein